MSRNKNAQTEGRERNSGSSRHEELETSHLGLRFVRKRRRIVAGRLVPKRWRAKRSKRASEFCLRRRKKNISVRTHQEHQTITIPTSSPTTYLPFHEPLLFLTQEYSLRSSLPGSDLRKMVQPGAALARRVGQAFMGCRAIHTQTENSRSTIARILEHKPADPADVVVTGFVRSIRNQKQRSFASIGDGSSLEPLQALLTPAQAQRSKLDTHNPTFQY